jgi:dethiobiotin synthetase
MGAFFITGSGTDVGKTFVTAALVRRLKAQGRIVEALKPVVSGYNADDPADSDPAILLEALGRPLTEENLAEIAPWRFRAPLSPDMAAVTEGRAIDAAAVVAFCMRAIAAARDVLLIEGVGGVMAPVGARQTQADLMSALDIPLIFVAGSYLGAISHALTGLDAIKCRGLDLRALVVDETPGSSVDLNATCASLENFTSAPVLALRRRDGAANEAALARLAALV